MDPAELRLKRNLIKKEQFPYTSVAGLGIRQRATTTPRWTRRSRRSTTPSLRAKEQAQNRAAFEQGRDPQPDGGGGRVLHRDRRRRPDQELRHPRPGDVRFVRNPRPSDRERRSRAWARSAKGQGHATTFAQILASEIGLPASTGSPSRRATPTPPPTASAPTARARHPVAGAAAAMAGRKIRAKAQMIAAHLLEVHDDDLEWDVGRLPGQGRPGKRAKSMAELAFAAYNNVHRRTGAWASRRSATTTRRT